MTFSEPSPENLLERLSAEEVELWMSYIAQRGLPHRNAELQFARHLAMNAAVPKDGPKPTIDDFLPYRKVRRVRTKQEQVQEAKKFVRNLKSMFGQQ